MTSTRDCERTQKELSSLIKELASKGEIRYSGPRKLDGIDAIEEEYSIRLPSDFRQFLANYGLLTGPSISIFGIEDEELDETTLKIALEAFRLADAEVPVELCPIEFLPDKSFACLVCDTKNRSIFTPVVLFSLHKAQSVVDLQVLAGCFRDYLYNRLVSLQAADVTQIIVDETLDDGWKTLERHVAKYQETFNYDHAKGGKLPRNTDYRPYRYCIQDVLFGVTVVRHNLEGNCLEVDVFLTAEIPEYGPLAGAQALTAFVLSEAYKCGGSMEIRFTKKVEGGRVPAEIQNLASQYSVIFKQANRGRIDASEAKALYAATTGFSEKLQSKIQQLENEGKMKLPRACYVVHHGVWSKEQLEMIVLGSENPDSIISGQSSPVQRHLYNHDIMHARAALMAGMFERVILQRERSNEEGVGFDMEDDLRELDIEFDGDTYVKSYRCTEDIELNWLYGVENSQSISENMLFHVLVRPRDQADLYLHLISDFSFAKVLKKEKNEPVFILVPRDFADRPQEWTSKVLAKTNEAGIGILVCPEAVNTLDTDAAQRLSISRVLRQ